MQRGCGRAAIHEMSFVLPTGVHRSYVFRGTTCLPGTALSAGHVSTSGRGRGRGRCGKSVVMTSSY